MSSARRGTRLAVISGMAPTTPKRPIWPSDDQVREHEGDRVYGDDGRKVTGTEHVGATVPDADADPERLPPPPRPPRK